jgi:hypothetical protein
VVEWKSKAQQDTLVLGGHGTEQGNIVVICALFGVGFRWYQRRIVYYASN